MGVIYDVYQKFLKFVMSCVGPKNDFQRQSKYNSHVANMSYLSPRKHVAIVA